LGTWHNLRPNSLEMVELVMALEKAHGIEISDEDAEKFRTIRDVIDYIERRKKGGDLN
jgi:acyl carrier protein